jgi:RNA polymerase sigma factor (sigma-70 family)
LDLLDKSPDEAFREFYSFAQRLLKVKPPRTLQGLSDAAAHDAIQEIILHCVEDDFRVLRKYRDRGRPFSAWFYMLAHNKSLDILRKKNREDSILSGPADSTDSGSGHIRPNPDISPEQRTRLRSAIDIVRKCMSMLGEYCRLLLQLAADEYTPREMVLVLGLPRDKAKKISDDLRECRKRLRRLTVEQGIDPVSLFIE